MSESFVIVKPWSKLSTDALKIGHPKTPISDQVIAYDNTLSLKAGTIQAEGQVNCLSDHKPKQKLNENILRL